METTRQSAPSSAAAFTHQQRELLRDLHAAGCIVIGEEVQRRFGLRSPIYINMRENLYARPELLWRVGGEFAWKIMELAAPPSQQAAEALAADAMAASMGVAINATPPAITTSSSPAPQVVVGIPDTATPLALTTAMFSWGNRTKPRITFALLRKEPKQYPAHDPSFWIGPRPVDAPMAAKAGKADQGAEAPAEYNLIDDVVASGLTKRAAAEKMRAEGISLKRIIVFFDRGQGDGLREEGFDLHAIFNLRQVVDYYASIAMIKPGDHYQIVEFLNNRRFDRETA